MAITIVGLFESRDRAEAVRDDLMRAGFDRSEVTLSHEPGPAREAGPSEEPGFWDQVKQWLGFEESAYYEEGARRGGTVVSINTTEDREQAAVDVLERYQPVDIDVEAERWRQEGWAAPAAGERPAEGETQRHEGEARVPLPEEELHVGKRRVQRGGVRIYRRVTEQPVERDVELTDEHVEVERRPVDKPADESAFQEKTIEAEETHEEPVVEKEARTREELILNKEQQKHTETVRDTVRRTEAEIEGGEGDQGADEAYRFGRELAGDARFSGRSFESIEPEAREAFERRNIGDWSREREKVRTAYERSRAA